MAETLFNHHLEKAGKSADFMVDSCGTGGWHAGEKADQRMRQTAEKHGLSITHRARQIQDTDPETFDYLLVMDQQNLIDVTDRFVNTQKKVSLVTDLTQSFRGKIIPDPYFGDMRGFEEVFQLLNNVTRELADQLIHQHSKQSES
ncbi:MAG: low molecular weight protein-tyrosine-phosphatase [Bacteroidota bacterium]